MFKLYCFAPQNSIICIFFQERLAKRRKEKLKKAQATLSDESEKRMKEFEERKENESYNMKADEVRKIVDSIVHHMGNNQPVHVST